VSVIAAAVQLMLSEGIPHDKIVEAIGRMEAETIRIARQSAFEADTRSPGAKRTAKWRASQTSQTSRTSHGVTERHNETPPPSLNDTPELLSKPSESNLNPPPFPPPPLARGRVVRLPRKPEYPPEFQMLWDVFPKHPNASKSEALRRWEQLDPGDRDNCLTGAMRYEDFLTAERRKRPDYPGLHLATFVHQRRWEAHLEAAE
jgi:hypothetical protein